MLDLVAPNTRLMCCQSLVVVECEDQTFLLGQEEDRLR
jgi:hypothetical protein